MGLGNWALFLVAGDYMSPVAYWNFEDYIQNSGFKDKINNNILYLNPLSTSSDNSSLIINHNVRGSSLLLNPNIVDTNGNRHPVYSGYISQLIPSGNFSFAFWLAGYEGLKEEYRDSYLTDHAAYFSIGKNNSDAFYPDVYGSDFSFSLNSSGDYSFNCAGAYGRGYVGRQYPQVSVDIGKWNFIYCEHDFDNKRLGVSINGTSKNYSIAFSGNAVNNSGIIYLYNNTISQASNDLISRNHWKIDELSFWNECLSEDKLKEYYHNGCAYSYSGDMRHHWLYPQRDISVSGFSDIVYADRLLGLTESGTPGQYQNLVESGKRWEYVNEALDPIIITDEVGTNACDNLYLSGQINKLKFGTGKLFVKPSSVIGNCTLVSNYGGGSGILRSIYFLDKNDIIIASSNINKSVDGNNLITYRYISEYLTVTSNLWDLSDTSMLLELESNGEYNFGVSKTNLLVSGAAIFETGLPLYESGSPLAFTLDLYEQGHINSSGRLDLYTAGHIAQDSGLTLYTYGTYIYNSSLPLYTLGYSTYSSGLDLYTNGHEVSSGYIPLFINGISLASGHMPLFIKNEPISNSGDFPLFIYGSSGDPVVFGGRPLYLEGNDNLSTYSTMPLFTKGPLSGVKYESLPLFLDSNTRVASSVDLFLKNAYVESGRQLRLFIQGDGTLDGGLPYTGTMPLYIERIEGSERGLSMFLQANDGVNSGLPLYLAGGTYASSGLDLYTTSYDRPSGLLKLYTCGY